MSKLEFLCKIFTHYRIPIELYSEICKYIPLSDLIDFRVDLHRMFYFYPIKTLSKYLYSLESNKIQCMECGIISKSARECQKYNCGNSVCLDCKKLCNCIFNRIQCETCLSSCDNCDGYYCMYCKNDCTECLSCDKCSYTCSVCFKYTCEKCKGKFDCMDCFKIGMCGDCKNYLKVICKNIVHDF